MKKNPLVYIVLPVYNGEKYFLEQLMSLYYQTYQNWYLIIVNDGSTDSSENIAKKFIKDYGLYDKVKILKKENGGLNSAIQKGLKEVKGMCDIKKSENLVAYCDCDDIWTRNKISIQVEYMIKHPECGLLGHNASIINDHGVLLEKRFFDGYDNGHFMYLVTMGSHYLACSIMFRLKYIDSLLPFPMQQGMAQDLWTVLVLSLLKVKIHYINESLFYYRKLPSGLQSTLEAKQKYIQNQVRFNYLLALEDKYPDNKDVLYVKQYIYDRFIKRHRKGYSLIRIYLLMLFKYPKIFFLGLKSFFFRNIFSYKT